MAARGDTLLDEEKKKPKQEQSSIISELEADSISDILSKIPNETLLEIFSHLPPEGVFKIRSISKTWSNLTRQCFFTSKYSRRTTITGFFYQERACINEEYHPNKPLFIPIEPERSRLRDPYLSFLKQKNRIVQIQVIDSCNGLLLCSGSRMGRFGLVKTWFVCNPVTMEKLALPYPRQRSYMAIYALIADLNSNGYLEFKVLCLFGPNKENPYSKLSIFSSETGEWEEFEGCLPPVCDNSLVCSEEVFGFEGCLPPVCDKSLMGSKVFFNGKLLWDCFDGHILVCHLNQKRGYELIEAPQAPLGRCLWVFEDKLRCYCHGFPNEFPAWSIHLNDYKNEPKWNLEGCEEFEYLSEDICMAAKGWVTTKKAIPRIRFKIIAYVPESQKIFFFIADLIYSYGLRNRSLKLVWACTPSRQSKFHSTSRLIPYVHSLAPIQTWKMDECGTATDLVQTDKDNYHNFVESAANNTKPTRSRKTTVCQS